MRLSFYRWAPRLLLIVWLSGITWAAQAAAQNPDTMMPEASEAKGKQVLQDLVNGLGGAGYLEVKDLQCHGRRAQFGHNGEVMGFVDFTNARRYPDKERIEYTSKGRNSFLGAIIGIDGLGMIKGGAIITVYNGDRGWLLDKSGVSELPETSVSDFQEANKRNVDNLLRFRLREDGLAIHYGGGGTVDLKPVDWVELVDKEQRTFRLAVDHSTHLLVRSIVTTSNEETNQRDDDVAIYTNYQLRDSVWTPLQITREKNGRRTAQTFYDTCKFNPGLADDVFEKSSLEKKSVQLGVKKDKKQGKEDN